MQVSQAAQERESNRWRVAGASEVMPSPLVAQHYLLKVFKGVLYEKYCNEFDVFI